MENKNDFSFIVDGDTKKRYSALDRESLINFEKMTNAPVNSSKGTSRNSFAKKYKKDDILKFLDDPKKNQKQLREISINLFITSSHYRRLINYIGNMGTFAYIIEPYNIDFESQPQLEKLKKKYKEASHMIDNMNLKHELLKVVNTCLIEDVFYGYEFETKDSYYLKKLDPDYCHISSVEDGVYNFSFDFKYFEGQEDLLESYPPEFQKGYREYQKTRISIIELSAERTMCIKANEIFEYPVPPFAGTFDSIYDIESYKKLRKAKEELGNYKVLVQQLPMRKDSELNNDFMIDFENMINFHNKASKSLPEQVGLITTPMEVKEFSFNPERVDSDNVAKAERDFWSSSGVSQHLFNADKSSTSGVDKSIRTDEEIFFAILRQIERWINRKVKRRFKNFRVNMLNITHFNKEEVFERALKSAQFGFPVKNLIGACLDIMPSSMMNMATLENDILELHNKFIPLQSSHTQEGGDPTDEGGAPTKSDGDISDEGERGRNRADR